jgi:nucleolar pre-ribosomal-associated protein 2
MTTNLDQTRSQEYVADAITYIRRLLPSEGSKVKGEPGGSFTSVALFQVVLTALLAKHAVLNRLGIITSDDLRGMTDSFKDSLLSRLKTLLKTPQKTPKADAKARVHLELLCIVDALTTFRADGIKLAALTDDVKSFIASMAGEDAELASRLETFMAVHGCGVDGEQFGVDLTGDTSIIFGRRGLLDKTNALVATMSQQEKLDLLKSMLVNDVIGTSRLDKVLAARYIIVSCKGLTLLTICKVLS